MSRRPLRRGRGKKRNRVNLPAPTTVTIETLESQGDGAARLADSKRVFVPRTLPGDQVEVEFLSSRGDDFAARATNFIHSVSRREADCPVFETCGGCQLQHLPDDDYLSWKPEIIRTAFARHGLDVVFQPLQSAPLTSRRRTTIKAIKTSERVIVGYNSAQSHQIVDIDTCPRLIGALNDLIEPIRKLARDFLPNGATARFSITDPGAGSIDLLIETDVDLDLEKLELLSGFAHQHGISRITKKGPDNLLEPVIELEQVAVSFAGCSVPLPPDSFLQPSSEGEKILSDLVIEAVGCSQTVIDLYAGVGTFSIPLAVLSKQVLAIDGARAQVAALQAAVNKSAGSLNLQTETRDLQRNPLLPVELNHSDAIVFDPPRAGAKDQAQEIALSTVPRVVAVSCNPATMARDLRILVDGGYAIQRVTPVDQFPMSYHIEAVAVLERPY